MLATRTLRVDFAKVYSSLQLGKNTVSSMQAFRKRADDAKRQLGALQEQSVDVDLAHYRKTLRNQDVVAQAEKILKDFKPVTYDVAAQLKAIDAFEAKAVSTQKKRRSRSAWRGGSVDALGGAQGATLVWWMDNSDRGGQSRQLRRQLAGRQEGQNTVFSWTLG